MSYFCFLILISLGLSTATVTLGSDSAKALKESELLTKTISEYTEILKKMDAYDAPYFNLEEDLSKFGDYASKEFFARYAELINSTSEKLKSISYDRLPEKDQLVYRLFKEDIDVEKSYLAFPTEFLSINQMDNRLHSYMDSSSQALTIFPFDSVKHYEDFVKRSEGFPTYIDNQIDVLRRGISKQIVLSCVVAEKVPATYKDALEADVTKNPFWRPIGFMPKSFSKADKTKLSQQFTDMIVRNILAGYKKFDAFFKKEYLPHCRKEFGLTGIPNADKWYKLSIRNSTNLELEPQKIHELGLAEVARIISEIKKIQQEVGDKTDVYAFIHTLGHDPKMIFKTSAEMFAAFEKVKTEIAAKIPHYFSLIPKSDYKIVETSNPEDAAASYFLPTESMPFGRFIVNTKNLSSVPKHGVTTLSLHEAVPGHHFQLALQYEMKDQLSEYQRKIFSSNAFAEGWALYAEYLGNEMGMFTDPYQRFGHLNDEMMRAVRLVVDTGIHALGWSQQKTIAYMKKNLGWGHREAEIEANRYSVWPGQALGYKIGQIKIKELRAKAEKELGKKFDIKGFHKAVIGNGTVTLGVLESQVNQWIDTLK